MDTTGISSGSGQATQSGRITWAEVVGLIIMSALAATVLHSFSGVRCVDRPPFFLKDTVYDCAAQKMNKREGR